MHDSLALAEPPGFDELRRETPLALFLDFDGTLVEIAATPGGIRVPGSLPGALETLCRKLEGRLALVSGRAIDDLQDHLGSIAIARAGSHGADCRSSEECPIGAAPPPMPPAASEELNEFVRQHRGTTLERKAHGAAIHYRGRPESEEQVVAFAEKIAAGHGLAIKRGKCVVELLSRSADKGQAVRAFMAQPDFSDARPVFIGDDVTDEDGFAAVAELGGIGILVGPPRDTVAGYRLEDPQAVHRWLELETE